MAVIEIEVRGDARQGERALDRIRVGVRQLDRSFDQAGRAADDATDEIRRGAAQAGGALDDAADSADGLADSLDQTGDGGGRLDDMLGGLTDRAGGFGQMLAGLGPIGAAAAAAVGAAFLGIGVAIKGAMAAAQASMERTNSLARSKALLGLDERQAAQFGKIAGRVYADNFGESIEEAGDAVREAVRILGAGAAESALEDVGKKVSALAALTQRDTQQIGFAIKQMLVTGVAKSADEAFDLIHRGIELGADGMDDLIDSMVEYPALLKQSGLSAKELFGLMAQGMSAGAFGTDKIADALKEFRLRVTGGGTAINDAFKSLGINGEKATEAISKGGRDGAAALDQVLDKIRALNETDPTKAAQAIQSLFGGPGEDLATALFALDVDKAAESMDGLEGAASRASATLAGSGYNAIESYRRRWEMFKADVGDELLPAFESIMETLEDVGEALGPIIDSAAGDIADMWNENSEAIGEFWEIAEPILKLLGGAAIGAVVLAIGQMINAMTLAGNIWGGIKDIFAAVTPFILRQFEMLLEGAAAAFGWIPGLGDKLRSARDNFKTFKDDVNAMLDGIRDKTVTVTIDRKVRGPSLGGQFGYQGFAKGTDNAPPGYAVVGEEGPELVRFRGGEQVRTAADSAAMMSRWHGGGYGGGGVQVIGITVEAGTGSADPTRDLVLDVLRRGAVVLKVDARGTVVAA